MNAEVPHWERYWQDESEHAWWLVPAPEVIRWLKTVSPQRYPRALDLGCGLGRHAVLLAQAGYQVCAVDAARQAVEHTRKRAAELNLALDVRQAAVRELAGGVFPPESFDLVLSYYVIYHGYRPDFADAIRSVQLLLSKGGRFYFTCPSRRDGKYGFGQEMSAHTWSCEKSVTPGDIHYFADEPDLRDLLAGFEIVDLNLDEGYWENQGQAQFFSNWQVDAVKI